MCCSTVSLSLPSCVFSVDRFANWFRCMHCSSLSFSLSHFLRKKFLFLSLKQQVSFQQKSSIYETHNFLSLSLSVRYSLCSTQPAIVPGTTLYLHFNLPVKSDYVSFTFSLPLSPSLQFLLFWNSFFLLPFFMNVESFCKINDIFKYHPTFTDVCFFSFLLLSLPLFLSFTIFSLFSFKSLSLSLSQPFVEVLGVKPFAIRTHSTVLLLAFFKILFLLLLLLLALLRWNLLSLPSLLHYCVEWLLSI